MTKQPIAVCISDLHFNLNNLELASAALKMAINKSNELQVPLVIAGDLHDTKAIIRAEVANRLLALFTGGPQQVYILVGNHDLINEKGTAHGLNYLGILSNVLIIDTVRVFRLLPSQLTLMPYQSATFSITDPAGIIIMHQGVKGAFMGDYIQDKSSIDSELLKNSQVISGHYHKHQTVGTVTYIGSPYTQSYGEANDPAKGFLVLYSDGSYDRVLTNLRKHIVIDRTLDTLGDPIPNHSPGDLVWIKIKGPLSELHKLDKIEIGQKLLGHSNYKLDLIADKVEPQTIEKSETLTSNELFETLILEMAETDEQKAYVKELYHEIISSSS